MPHSLARPGAVLGAVAILSCAGASLASPPIPPVATIPVPPLAVPARIAAPAAAPAPAPTPAPAAAPAHAPEPASTPVLSLATTADPASGAPEAMPSAAASEPPPAPRILLVDEGPFRSTHMRAREVTEGAHHGHRRGRHGRPYHPAPGIVVDVLDSPGGAVVADLQRPARNLGYWPFRHCYEEGLRRDQSLSGKVALDVQVAPDGSVDDASIAGATLHDPSVVLCVAREARHLALPGRASPTTARMNVTLATGDEPVPVPRPALHADRLRDALRASWPAVAQCYASALPRQPDAGGRMELRFVVRRDGTIDDVAEGDTRFGEPDVTRCVLGVYRGVTLPARHGHTTKFVYALHFEASPQNVSPTAK